MVKIFIDPGHGGTDPGASGNGIQEKNITWQIADQIRDILNEEYENVSIKMSRSGDQTVSLSARTAAANSWGAALYLSVHVNAGGGTGFESYVYPNVDAQTRRYQDAVHGEVLKQVNFNNRGKKQANFHVLRETTMPAVLTENGFIDTAGDANKLKDKPFISRLARGHANGIAKAFNLKKKSDASSGRGSAGTDIGGSGNLYKVQIGAFSKRENAEDLAERARKAGFNVFIVHD